MDFIWIRDKVGINHFHENFMIHFHFIILLRVPFNLLTQTQGYDTNYIHIQCAKQQILCQVTQRLARMYSPYSSLPISCVQNIISKTDCY